MNDIIYKVITECRVCGHHNLQPIIELGNQPPANCLRKELDEELPNIPLSIVRCNECATVQLTVTVNPEFLFKNYVWVTGTSTTATEYSKVFYSELSKRCEAGSLFIIEVASNDGTFLKQFKNFGHKVLGVDPAKNIAEIAEKQGIPIYADFFSLTAAKKIVEQNGNANCVFARNVIPHVNDVHDVIAGIAHCLSDSGTGAIEFHYAQIILDELHYDSIYHEHLYYYSLKSMQTLLKKHGLFAFDLIESPISGGSLVLYISKNKRKPSVALNNKIKQEENNGLNSQEQWEGFAHKSIDHKNRLKEVINQELELGSKLIGYGASARSSTLLNYCEIDNRHLICIADKSSMKHNQYTPGTNILIVSPETALSKNPNVVLLLAWNFKDEILSLLNNKYGFKGKVIIPLPNDIQVVNM